jgi:hypothetical protein
MHVVTDAQEIPVKTSKPVVLRWVRQVAPPSDVPTMTYPLSVLPTASQVFAEGQEMCDKLMTPAGMGMVDHVAPPSVVLAMSAESKRSFSPAATHVVTDGQATPVDGKKL